MLNRLTWISLAIMAVGVLVYYYLFVLPAERLPDRQQVLRVIADVERAIERERVSSVMQHISDDYEDSYGFNRRMVQRLVLAAARDSRSLNLSVQVPELEVDGDFATFVAEVSYTTGDEPVGIRDAQQVTVVGQMRRERGRWMVISADGWQGARHPLY